MVTSCPAAQEAIGFLCLHQALRRALPRYRAELDEIAALARPLMPARVQRDRLDRPHPPTWPLPIPFPSAVGTQPVLGLAGAVFDSSATSSPAEYETTFAA